MGRDVESLFEKSSLVQYVVYGYKPLNRLIILQILTRDSKGISEEQMKEFRTSFNFFDKVCAYVFV